MHAHWSTGAEGGHSRQAASSCEAASDEFGKVQTVCMVMHRDKSMGKELNEERAG